MGRTTSPGIGLMIDGNVLSDLKKAGSSARPPNNEPPDAFLTGSGTLKFTKASRGFVRFRLLAMGFGGAPRLNRLYFDIRKSGAGFYRSNGQVVQDYDIDTDQFIPDSGEAFDAYLGENGAFTLFPGR